jgi:hypothetical protein
MQMLSSSSSLQPGAHPTSPNLIHTLTASLPKTDIHLTHLSSYIMHQMFFIKDSIIHNFVLIFHSPMYTLPTLIHLFLLNMKNIATKIWKIYQQV